MRGRIFLLDNNHIYVRDGQGNEVNFNSIDEFNNYYPGTIDLSDDYYIDYEPDKKLFYYRNDPEDFSALVTLFDEPVEEYEAVITGAGIMKERQEDPYYGMNLEESRVQKFNQLKRMTYHTITRNMPEWKQMKWNEYIRLHEKKKARKKLTAYEQDVYERFRSEDETHNACYRKAQAVMTWIQECVEANDVTEKKLSEAKDIKSIKELEEPEYPIYPI